jgi:hypothetical protein
MLNYSLLRTWDLGWGFAKWRGLSVGTGLLYQSTVLDWKINMDSQSKGFQHEESGKKVIGEITIDPSVNLGLESKTWTVPLDITTSIQLFYAFNLNLGAGVDVNMGSSDVILTSAGAVTVKNTAESDATITTVAPERLLSMVPPVMNRRHFQTPSDDRSWFAGRSGQAGLASYLVSEKRYGYWPFRRVCMVTDSYR